MSISTPRFSDFRTFHFRTPSSLIHDRPVSVVWTVKLNPHWSSTLDLIPEVDPTFTNHGVDIDTIFYENRGMVMDTKFSKIVARTWTWTRTRRETGVHLTLLSKMKLLSWTHLSEWIPGRKFSQFSFLAHYFHNQWWWLVFQQKRMHCDNSIFHDNQSVICLGSKLLIGQKEIRCGGAIEPERFPEIVVNTKMSCFLHYHSKCFTRNNYGLFMVLKIYFMQFYPLKSYKCNKWKPASLSNSGSISANACISKNWFLNTDLGQWSKWFRAAHSTEMTERVFILDGWKSKKFVSISLSWWRYFLNI